MSIDSEKWKLVQSLFERALELPEDDRDRFLRGECGGDEELLREVLSLIASDRESNQFLEGRALEAVGISEDFAPEGSVIGPYQIIRQIGFGGMGAVYLAERSDGQFRQQVALKVIKRGMDTDAILQRFQGERQILAALSHPNIARLYDGGVTEEGVPYFTMEYVDGEPIDEYCRNNRLNLKDRIALFLQACRAVVYAQRNLIVHRDLKPSNIVVDKTGQVKLLDFGIAKVLGDSPMGEKPLTMTHTGMRVMTPGYAAPEQVRADPISTATDVYALGIILYELLTGKRPYQTDTGSPSELENIICNTQPNKPSTLVGKLKGAREHAGHAGISVEKLARMLKGDLDTICLTALRKEPERRYLSAEQLQEDIERYLKGQPIKARPDTTIYRAGKFIRRHRFSLSFASIFVILFGALITFYTFRLAEERDYARTEAKKATEVSEFLAEMFEAADPNLSKGEEITADQLLDDGARRIHEELGDQPEVQAELMQVIGNVYLTQGKFDETFDMFRPALSIALDRYGPGDPRTADAYRNIGVAFHDLDQLDSTLYYYRKAFVIDSTVLGMRDSTTVTDLNYIAIVTRHMGDFDKAEKMLRQVLAIRRKILAPDNLELAHTLNHLGRMLSIEGRNEEAIPYLREGLKIRIVNLGEEHFEVGASRGALAGALKNIGEYDESEKLYRENSQMMEKMVGEDHHYTGAAMNSIANLRMLQGDSVEADSLFRRSLSILEKTLPKGHPSMTFPLMGLGGLLIGQGRADKALPLLKRSEKILTDVYGEEHWKTAQIYYLIGRCYRVMGVPDSAEANLTRAAKIFKRQYGTEHEFYLKTTEELKKL